VRRLRRYAHSPKGDHDGHARGISVYFNGTQTVGPSSHTWRPRSCLGLGSGSWSRRTRGGPGAAPGWVAGAGAAGHVVAPELPRAGSGRRSRRTRGGPGAASGWAAGARAARHVATPKPTSAGRRGPELQLAWQCVDTRPAPCLDLELICGGTRSSRYRQLTPFTKPICTKRLNQSTDAYQLYGP
jgi:hypothetical protein